MKSFTNRGRCSTSEAATRPSAVCSSCGSTSPAVQTGPPLTNFRPRFLSYKIHFILLPFTQYPEKRLAKETLTWDDLEKILFRVKDQIPSELVIKLYNSVPSRLNIVLKSKGTVIGC